MGSQVIDYPVKSVHSPLFFSSVESVHSLSENEKSMTVGDTQEDDTATASGPDVIGDSVSEGDEPEDSQQTPRPQRCRLPPPVFTYDALGRMTYCWPNTAAVQGGWYQLPVPPVM